MKEGGGNFLRHPGNSKPHPHLCFFKSDFFNLSKYRDFN